VSARSLARAVAAAAVTVLAGTLTAAMVAPDPWRTIAVAVLGVAGVAGVLLARLVVRAQLGAVAVRRALAARAAVTPAPSVDAAAAEATAILQPDDRRLPSGGCDCDHCQTLRAAVIRRYGAAVQPLPPVTPWSVTLLMGEIDAHLRRFGRP
jgi:hypothetical protein